MTQSVNSTIRPSERVPRTVAESESDLAVDVLTRAFWADPVLRWMLPGAEQYRNGFPAFARAFAGRAFGDGTAYQMEDAAGRCIGAALWIAPGLHADDEALEGLLERLIPTKDHDTVFPVFEQLAAFHPEEPHWYLPLLGVDPDFQRQGWGSALLRPVLETCDRDGTPAYLESSNPANLSLYQRHGFEQIGIVQLGTSEPLFPMVRRPRRDPFRPPDAERR